MAAIREEAARDRPQRLAKLMKAAHVSRCPCGPCILDSATAAAARTDGDLHLSLQELAELQLGLEQELWVHTRRAAQIVQMDTGGHGGLGVLSAGGSASQP